MQRREIRMLESKLRNTKDKKEVVVRERKLLAERIEALVKVKTYSSVMMQHLTDRFQMKGSMF
jgi:hypothetical protein